MGRTGHQGQEEEEGKGARKRIDLSVSQVAGAGAATLAAATAASYLNVYGTIIGTAVMAVLSTLASPLLQHWFSRGGEQARSLAGRAVGQGGVLDPHAPGAAVAPEPGGICETALLRQVSGAGITTADSGESDVTRTMALPMRDGSDGARGDTATRTAQAGPTGADGSGGGFGLRWRGRGWRSPVVPAVAVFVLVMLVILVFELFTGRSLTSWTRGDEQATSPTLLGGTTSAPPASELDTPAITEDAPHGSTGQPGEKVPATDEPTGPAPGTEEDGGTQDGTPDGAPEGAPEGADQTTEPTGPPAEEPQGPGQGEAPGPGTGEQEGEGNVPDPEPAVPPTN